MIPKKIHYCWFGSNELPDKLKVCIESWSRCCPDYEIVEWNDSNVTLDCPYVVEAFSKEQWAFVADYVRIYVLHSSGGIYLDTDILLFDNLDRFLDNPVFIGLEDIGVFSGGIIGSISGHCYMERMLKFYRRISFKFDDQVLIPRVLTYFYLRLDEGVRKEIRVEPPHVFYPLPYANRSEDFTDYLTPESVGVHLWNESWKDAQMLFYENRTVGSFMDALRITKLSRATVINILRVLKVTTLYHKTRFAVGYLLSIILARSRMVRRLVCEQTFWSLRTRAIFTPPFSPGKSDQISEVECFGTFFLVEECEYNGWRTKYNFYDRHIFEIVDKYIHSKSTVIDVGSNVGFYSMLFAKRANDGVVYGFEPNLSTYELLNETIKKNKVANVFIAQTALGATSTKYSLINEDANNHGKTYVSLQAEGDSATVSLDSFVLESRLERLDLIKVDIEGFEYQFLLGAVDTLRKYKPVVYMEVNDEFLYRYDNTAREVIEFFENLNYKISDSSGVELASNRSLIGISTDVLCVPR